MSKKRTADDDDDDDDGSQYYNNNNDRTNNRIKLPVLSIYSFSVLHNTLKLDGYENAKLVY
jgi:hypothetical protein